MLSAPAGVGERWIPRATSRARHSVRNPTAAGPVISALSRSLGGLGILRAALRPLVRRARTTAFDRVTDAESLTSV